MANKRASTAEKAKVVKRVAKKVGAKPEGAASRSMPKEGKDPKGGLTAKGREYFNKKEGSHLRPGVQGPADTPEKMVRKGSFLRRHFTHPRGPMKDDKGQPTRLALSAHAWGEPVPKTMGEAKKLAQKGHELLERYHEIQNGGKEASKGRQAVKKVSSKKSAAKKTVSSRKMAAKRSARKTVDDKKSAGKRTAGTRAGA